MQLYTRRASRAWSKPACGNHSDGDWKFDTCRYVQRQLNGSYACRWNVAAELTPFVSTVERLSLADNDLIGPIPSALATMTTLGTECVVATFPSMLLLVYRRIARILLTSLSLHAPELLELYGNNLNGPFTCPDSIEVCFVSCNTVAEECRMLGLSQ